MGLIQKIRFSMGTIMMFVLMIAAGMALFVKIQNLTARGRTGGPCRRVGTSTYRACFARARPDRRGSWFVEGALGRADHAPGYDRLLRLPYLDLDQRGPVRAGDSLLVPGHVRRDRHAADGRPAVRQVGLAPGAQARLVEEDVRGGFLLVLDDDPCDAGGLLQAAVYLAASAIPPVNSPVLLAPHLATVGTEPTASGPGSEDEMTDLVPLMPAWRASARCEIVGRVLLTKVGFGEIIAASKDPASITSTRR